MMLHYYIAVITSVFVGVFAGSEQCESDDDVHMLQTRVAVNVHQQPSRDARSEFAFAFLLYGNLSDQFVSARALVQGLRFNGVHSDIVAIVPQDDSPPQTFLRMLEADGIRIFKIESLASSKKVLERWRGVMNKLAVFSMTQYLRVALLDLDIVPETGVAPESIFRECKGSELCAVSDLEQDMLNAGVMLVHPSQARFEHLVEKMRLDILEQHNDTFPEQAFLQRYAAENSSMFRWSELPEKYNSCSQGGWLLNVGDERTDFEFIHACSWSAKMCNIKLCSSAPDVPCRHSVKLFQTYHAIADPCIVNSALGRCSAASSCKWCGHYCSNSGVPCSSILFATEDNPNKHGVHLDQAVKDSSKGDQSVISPATRVKMPQRSTTASSNVHAVSRSGTNNSQGSYINRYHRGAAPELSILRESTALYYAMIDRVAAPAGHSAPQCTSLDDYCGGTVAALEAHLPYLEELGVDGILVSPLLQNMPKGYHGYWTRSLTELNTQLGTADDISHFVHSANVHGMYVAADLNLNHFGKRIEDLPELSPFNMSEHFHDCAQCNSVCSIDDYNDERQVEQCRLFGMPDLNQDNHWVRSELKHFVRNYVNRFGFAALRLDAARHLPGTFVDEIAEGAVAHGKPIPVLPEMYSEDVFFTSTFARDTSSPTMNFPLFLELRRAFGNGTSLTKLSEVQHEMMNAVPEPRLLYNFVNTHDVPRFLALYPDMALYSNALVFALCNVGVPVILYGDEQDIKGGTDPDNANEFRVPLWQNSLDFRNTKSIPFRLIQKLLQLRPEFTNESYRLLNVDDHTLVFARGHHIFVVSNFGSHSQSLPAQRVVYLSDTGLCNVQRFCDALANAKTGCIHPEDKPVDDDMVYGAGSASGSGSGSGSGYGQSGETENTACILRVDVPEDGMPRAYVPMSLSGAPKHDEIPPQSQTQDRVPESKVFANVTLLTVRDIRQMELNTKLSGDGNFSLATVSVSIPLRQFRRLVPQQLSWTGVPEKFLSFSQDSSPHFDDQDWWPQTSRENSRFAVVNLHRGCAASYNNTFVAFLNQELTGGALHVVIPRTDVINPMRKMPKEQQDGIAQLQMDVQNIKHIPTAEKRMWFIHNFWSGFYHILIDLLPDLVSLGVLEELRLGKAVALFSNQARQSSKHVIQQYLEHLGVNTEKHVLFMTKEGDMRCAGSELLVPVGAWALKLPPRGPLELLRDQFLPRCPSLACRPEPTRHSLVYVSRMDATDRRVANEADVLETLQVVASEFGLTFNKFVATEHSIAETITVFSQARLVVGAHGAGLSNLIHARSTTQVIEIVPHIPNMVNAHYWHLANALELDYWLHGEDVPASSLTSGEMDCLTVPEFHVDTPRLAKIVQEALNQGTDVEREPLTWDN
jgi:alpha-amylase